MRKRKADEGRGGARSLTEKVRGGRSRQAMSRIVQSVARLQEIVPTEETVEDEEEVAGERTNELALSIPLERIMGDDEEMDRKVAWNGKMPWARSEQAVVFRRMKKEITVTAAELTLPEELLARLRMDARKLGRWVKAKKAGVTQDVVDEIWATWRKSELAMVKFVAPLCRNMDRAREIIEIKTGGLVVWSKKDTLVVYRGSDYKTYKDICFPALADGENTSSSELIFSEFEDNCDASSAKCDGNIGGIILSKAGGKYPGPDSKFFEINGDDETTKGTLFEREANRLLDGLGPRFVDWWLPKPLPVDADLLPEVVPDYKLPLRLCPPHMRPKLSDDELTYLRRLARPLPTHFALGKNSKLQGLAAAIIKLWEKSTIAKIAVKWGIPNTNSEHMAYKLKHLTGGVLILRNKFFIILYRGKDFLPGKVANTVFERQTELEKLQLQEEQARVEAIEAFHANDNTLHSTSAIGTNTEFQVTQTNYKTMNNGNWEVQLQIEAEKEILEKELRKQEHQLSILKLKIEKSEKELAKLSSRWRPSVLAADQELLTGEEREAFRRLGLKMDEILLLGRRGIYDGIIGSIHMHWKHREVVKIITMQRSFSQITQTASLLEIESGGILVAVEKLRRGHVIIIYRGKNYQTPLKLQPENLLTKRESLQRSIEMQRRGSLKFFAYQRQQSIWELKGKLRDLEKRSTDFI